jgi:hypothetical protein
MVIDAGGTSPRVVTGSMNWSNSGDAANDENTLIVFSADVAATYQAAFDELYDALGQDTLCELGVYYVHLPVLVYDLPPTPTPTPTQTGTPVPTTTPTPTLTPTPTQTSPPPTTGNMNIFNIFADGAGSSEPDEHVDLRNDDNVPIQLAGWTLRDIANHVFTFPSYVIQPGEVCRVYTNEFHPEWCGFNYGSGSAIWNNPGDCAYLRNNQGQDIDTYCY